MPEFYKKSKRKAEHKWEKRIYFCHVGRSAGRTLIWNYIQAGWEILNDNKEKPNREEILENYKGKIKKPVPSESFAIVRHPISRIESHLKWAICNNKVKRKEDGFFDYISLSIDNMYEEEYGRNIIPAFETVFFDATVFQYEMGLRKIADYLVENDMIEVWTKNIYIKEKASARILWEECPSKLKDKILKVYEKDFEAFGYDPYDFLKK